MNLDRLIYLHTSTVVDVVLLQLWFCIRGVFAGTVLPSNFAVTYALIPTFFVSLQNHFVSTPDSTPPLYFLL